MAGGTEIRRNLRADEIEKLGNIAPGSSTSGINTGDEPVFVGAGATGVVPDPVAETGKYLKDDGTWDDPAGGSVEEQAEMHFTVNNLITVIVGTFTPIKISGLTTAGVVTSQFSHSNGRLTKTSAGSKNYKVHAEFNADKLGGGSDGYVFYIAKNGTLVNKSEKEVRLTSQEKSISLQSIIPMAQNDYIEIWVEGIDDDDNILVIDLNVTIRK
jgi:hypothetical protein